LLAITSKSNYAIRALSELARRESAGPVPLGEIARRRDIPVQFLEGLFALLRRGGILQSQRGIHGGYLFARPPDEVTVLEVVELLDGELVSSEEDPGMVWQQMLEAVRGVLGSVTISELADREARAAGSPMYYI
jgi:Rrf2 family transcriptional regulator, cysteine metabolism repressor